MCRELAAQEGLHVHMQLQQLRLSQSGLFPLIKASGKSLSALAVLRRMLTKGPGKGEKKWSAGKREAGPLDPFHWVHNLWLGQCELLGLAAPPQPVCPVFSI